MPDKTIHNNMSCGHLVHFGFCRPDRHPLPHAPDGRQGVLRRCRHQLDLPAGTRCARPHGSSPWRTEQPGTARTHEETAGVRLIHACRAPLTDSSLVRPRRRSRGTVPPGPAGNHQDPVRTAHPHGGDRGCGGEPDHSLPRAAEENNDDEGPGCLDRSGPRPGADRQPWRPLRWPAGWRARSA